MKKLFFFALMLLVVAGANAQNLNYANPSSMNQVYRYYIEGSSASFASYDTTTIDTSGTFRIGAFPKVNLHVVYNDTIGNPYFVVHQKFASETRWRAIDSIILGAGRGVNSTTNPREQCLAMKTNTAATNVDKFPSPDALYRLVYKWNQGLNYSSDSCKVKLILEFVP